MIEFNEVFCLDLKDDFEELGRHERNFELDEFIQKDLSRAFAFGYCHLDWIKEKMAPEFLNEHELSLLTVLDTPEEIVAYIKKHVIV